MVDLLAADTGVAPFVVAGDLTATEHSLLLGHTVVVVEPMGFGCTVVSVETATVV